jgi:hypothetical protein
MFVLHKVNDKYRGASVCDICHKPLDASEEAKAIIAAQGSEYHPRSQVHTKCLDENSINRDQDAVMSLHEYINAMIGSF